MIQLSLSLTARPNKYDAVVQTLNSVARWAQLNGKGVRCQIWIKADQSDSLCYIEEWPAIEDLERRMCEEGFTRLLAVMEVASEPPVLEFRSISEIRGLEYVEEVRSRPPAAHSP